MNVQSVTSKTLEIRELIAEKSLDILALTETWLSNNDSSKIAELLPDTLIGSIMSPEKNEVEKLDCVYQKDSLT